MKTFFRIISWLITILTTVVLVMTAARLFFTPAYLGLEYRTPGFPDDPYGFSLQDRLKYGRLAVEYLNNTAGISFLGDLRFPAGQQAPPATCQFMTDCTHLFNDRELEHMVDVKNVYQGAIHLLEGCAIILVLFLIWAWRGKWMRDYLKGLQHGGLFALILLGIVVLSVLLVFNYFFVFFHEVFFKAGTWTFLYSDTLIRLFPERFWQDTFLFGGILSVVFGLIFFFVFRRLALRQS